MRRLMKTLRRLAVLGAVAGAVAAWRNAMIDANERTWNHPVPRDEA